MWSLWFLSIYIEFIELKDFVAILLPPAKIAMISYIFYIQLHRVKTQELKDNWNLKLNSKKVPMS